MRVRIEDEHKELLSKVLSHVDTAYSKGMEAVVPTKLKIYGVRVPTLRTIAAQWKKEKKEVGQQELLKLIHSMWSGGSREEKLLALILSNYYRGFAETMSWGDFLRWGRDVDNWEVGDGLAVILGEWVSNNPQARIQRFRDLVADDYVWLRRLGVVATVFLNRMKKDISFPRETLQIVDAVKHEKHPMITKAVSWALRALSSTDRGGVESYLRENERILAAHVVREVENKLTTGKKTPKKAT